MAQISIVKKSELEGATRLDAEYYQPKYLGIVRAFQVLGAIPLSDVAKPIKRGFTPADNPFNYIEIAEVDISTGATNAVEIAGTEAPSRAQWIVREGDVIVSTVRPARNAVALIGNSEDGFVCSSGFIVLRPFKTSAEFLFAYLKTSLVASLLDRKTTATMYPAVSWDDVLSLPVVLPDSETERFVSEKVKESSQKLKDSDSLYIKAKQLLLDELGFKDLDLSHQLCYTVSFKKTKEASRLDAEYFQPMYEEVENILSKRPRKTLESICSMINYGTVPTSPYTEEGMPYIKGSNLIDGLVQGKLDFLENTESLPKKFYTKEYDIIISQMGTVGKAGLVSKEQENWLFASFTIRARLLNHDFINPYVLTLYINNVTREWYLLRKIAQASVRQNTDLPTIKNLLVPKIAQDIQDKIRSILMESYELKNKSKRLLEIAKRRVEDLVKGKGG